MDERARHETPAERADRNLADLLQELRVAQTGVQILFSLLLTVPFSARYGDLTAFQRRVYVVALLLAAAASVVLTAPVAHHRLVFQRGQKPWLVRLADHLAALGLALTACAVSAVVLLVLDVVLGRTEAVAATAVVAVSTAVLYVLPPAVHRRQDEGRPDSA